MHSFLFLLLSISTALPTPPSSSLLQPLPVPSRPFGTRLFLTDHPNFLNLVWTCKLPSSQADKGDFEENTTVKFRYNSTGPGDGTVVRYAGTGNVTARYKESAAPFLLGQFNTTLQLLPSKTLQYWVSCGGLESPLFTVKYKYWDASTQDQWSIVSVGSLGLYNTTKLALGAIQLISDNVENVLWTIPGGLVADPPEGASPDVSQLESWSQWLSWILLVENVTCCVPVAASPSKLDLYPYTQDTALQSNFRHFMELPFSQDHQVLWYSFNHRNLHVVSICSYCDLQDNSTQYLWLENDLKEADASNDTHWIMVMGHDPVYENDQSPARRQLDKLLDKYNVDFAVWSHERWYERTKPLRNSQVTDERVSNSLHHVNGTIHYTCGTGGVPLQTYNMDKYKHTAWFYASQYGACSFHRLQEDVYNSMFVYKNETTNEIVIRDHVQISKMVSPPDPSGEPEHHFGRFMKLFGSIVVGGSVLMLLLIVLIKTVQKHDPAFIATKIRNIRYKKNATNLTMSCEQLNTDDVEDTRDTVMLLEEEEVYIDPLVSTAALYGITM